MRLCTKHYIDGFSNQIERDRLAETQKKWSGKELYHCEICGQLGYYSADQIVTIQRIVLPVPEHFSKHLLDQNYSAPTNLNNLLKIAVGESMLSDVIEQIGRPFAKHRVDAGHLLCYFSEEPSYPHSILIDPIDGVVKLVSIHNDSGAFDLRNLGNAYGQREIVNRAEEFEMWMYATHGVAFVAVRDTEEEILFVQFFEKEITNSRYLEMNCFLDETMKCNFTNL